jgi:hypothetical protein
VLNFSVIGEHAKPGEAIKTKFLGDVFRLVASQYFPPKAWTLMPDTCISICRLFVSPSFTCSPAMCTLPLAGVYVPQRPESIRSKWVELIKLCYMTQKKVSHITQFFVIWQNLAINLYVHCRHSHKNKHLRTSQLFDNQRINKIKMTQVLVILVFGFIFA